MELIKNNIHDNFPQMCLGCSSLQKKILANLEPEDNGDYYCTECLIKALLMVRPIEFDKELLSQWIKHISGTDFRSEYNNNLRKFVDWILPFLESK